MVGKGRESLVGGWGFTEGTKGEGMVTNEGETSVTLNVFHFSLDGEESRRGKDVLLQV